MVPVALNSPIVAASGATSATIPPSSSLPLVGPGDGGVPVFAVSFIRVAPSE
jgi:hypothetical protein